MQFGSKPPYSADPFPYVWPEDRRTVHMSEGPLRSMFSEGDGIALIYDPRPKFDLPQCNATNPILWDFRESHGDAQMWLDVLFDDREANVFLAGVPKAMGRVTAEHIVHAIRVLTRLASHV